MAKVLKNIFNAGTDEIKQSFTIESWHVSQSVDALTGVQDYDITISGSLTLTGSTNITGSTVINGGVTINGSPTVNGTLTVTQGTTSSLFGTASWAQSASQATSASYALNSTDTTNAQFIQVTSFNGNNQYPIILASNFGANQSLYGDADSALLYNPSTNTLFNSGAVILTGSISMSNGSLFGTASWANNAISASYALTSSYASYAVTSSVSDATYVQPISNNSTYKVAFTSDTATADYQRLNIDNGSGEFTYNPSTNVLSVGVITASAGFYGTSSWAENAISASHTLTASFINPLRQDVFITGAVIISGSAQPELRVIGETQFTGSVIISGSTILTGSLNILSGSITLNSGSLIGTSSWAIRALTASFLTPLTQSVIVSGSIVVTGSVTVGDYNLVNPVSLFNGWVPNTIGTPLIQPFVVKSINYPVRLYNHFANLGDNRFFDSVGNNRFHGRSDLIGVSVNGGSFSNTTYARLFNGDYDEFNVLQLSFNDSASVKIDLNRYGYAGVDGITYPQGQIHALFYDVFGPLSMSIEYYTTSSGGLVTSSIFQFTPYDYINQGYPVPSNNYFNSWRVDVPQTNGLIGFTLFITASGGIQTYFSELEYLGSRIDYNGGGNFSREGGYVKNINVRNNAIISGSLRVSGSITGSNLSINGFPNVSASLATLSSGVGDLQQVTDAGNTTTNSISSSFAGVGFYGTASWAITASHALNAASDGDMLFITASTFTTQSKNFFYFTSSVGGYDIGSTNGTDPSSTGDISFNSATKSSVTQIKITSTDENGTNLNSWVSAINKGSKLYFAHPTRGEGWYTVISQDGGSVGPPAFYTFNVLYVSESGLSTWTVTDTDFTYFYANNPLNVNLTTGYTQLTFSGSQDIQSSDYNFGGYLTVRLHPNINNKPGDITVLEYSNTSEADVKIDLQYSARSGSESQSNFSYAYNALPVDIYEPYSSNVPPLLISSSDRGTISLMTIKYASGSTNQLGFMKLGFENVQLT